MSRPYITSRINGLKIPLLPHQAGILHRFSTPENRLFISDVSEHDDVIPDNAQKLTIAASEDPATPAPQGKRAKEPAL